MNDFARKFMHGTVFQSFLPFKMLGNVMENLLTSKQIFCTPRLKKLCLCLLVMATLIHVSEENECFPCKSSGCRRVLGIFNRPSLPLGYNLIARIPASSCNLVVTEMTPSNNFLALRTSEGYIINGNWNVVPTGRYMGAGTGFLYSHSTRGEGESIFAPGPFTVDVDVMVIYQSNSLNIQYEYWLPVPQIEEKGTNPVTFQSQRPPLQSHHVQPSTGSDVPRIRSQRPITDSRLGRINPAYGPHRRNLYARRQHRYLENNQPTFVASPPLQSGSSGSSGLATWKVWKFTPCSKSCGGGHQKTVHICTGSDGKILEDYHCGDSKPVSQTVACNTKPCPPRWAFGEWSQCSVTCGTGQMTRTLSCIQEVSNSMTRVLPHTMCPANKPMTSAMATMQLCNIAPCTRWHVSPWGKCSVECGTGTRQRDVMCQAEGVIVSPNQCNEQEKPFHQELCHAHICAKHTWFFTEWTEECIGGCENGIHIRRVWCSPGVNSIEYECSLTDRPPSTKPCTNVQACGAAWFTGPWTPCSSLCGNGTRNREVVCVIYLRGSFRATIDSECDPSRRPEAVGVCNTETCPPHWYFTDWTECTRKCGRGSQRRAVQCLDSAQRPSLQCEIEERPHTTRPCNTQSCKEHRFGNCVDRFQNCPMVQRARLCKYAYYKTICCASCRGTP